MVNIGIRTSASLLAMAALLAHRVVLEGHADATFSSPISDLSAGHSVMGHTFVIALVALSLLLLALRLQDGQRGPLTRCIQSLFACNSLVLFALAYCFTIDSPTLHTLVLSTIASIIGTIMGLDLAVRLRRKPTALASVMQTVFFVLWLALIPLYWLVAPDTIGIYQRCVALLLLIWIVFMAIATPAHRQVKTPSREN